MILKHLGLQMGEGVFLEPTISFYNPKLSNIKLGERVYINRDVRIDNYAPITVDDDTAIGMGTTILTSTHLIGNENRRGGRGYKLPVTIGKGCWICANVTILPGVVIGNGVIVGAGAVVAKDLPDNGLYLGIPARLETELVVESDFNMPKTGKATAC